MVKNRLEIQTELDSLKSAKERNRLGQFATPPELAQSITAEALKLFQEKEIRFIEPALGTGSFYEALLGARSSVPITRALRNAQLIGKKSRRKMMSCVRHTPQSFKCSRRIGAVKAT